jgi:hypothetical protein
MNEFLSKYSTNDKYRKIQDRKVTQPILKYLLMVTIQYNSNWLINTQYRCDYTKAHAGHVMLQPDRASPSVVFQQSNARISFSQVQWVFIVKHYLASCSYLTCQNEFRVTFPDSPVPIKSTISCLVNCFHDTGSVQDRHHSGRPSVLSDYSLTISVKLCYALHENHCENFLFRVDYPTEVYIRLQRF